MRVGVHRPATVLLRAGQRDTLPVPRAGDMIDTREATRDAAREIGGATSVITSIGQNPFTETIYFHKYSVYEGFLGKNTR